MIQEDIVFWGHPNVQSLHGRTIEITKDEHLTLKGDCIIGVRSNKACSDLIDLLKNKLKSSDSFIKIEILVKNESFVIHGRGDERLTLQNEQDIVIRKTNFVCPRTMSVKCDVASTEMPRTMVNMLQSSETKGIFRITIE